MQGLPLDVLPDVFDALSWRVGDLAACCRVCHTWNQLGIPRLYERLWLRDHLRVVRVFHTLADSPHLAKHVRILELRVFPFGMPAEDLEALEENIVRSLHATINLRELCWTRDGSLNDRVLRTMFDNLQQLRKLELTGNSKLWSPALLCEVIPKSVCDLQIVLPDRNVIQYLPRLIKSVRRLEAFSLFCMNTSWVTDALLTELAPNTSLRRLTLVGCKAVHGPGILSLAQTGDLSMLALEGLMLRPETFHSLLPYTRKVSSLTVTYPKHNEDVSLFFSSLTELICSCENLTSLTLYARSGSAPALHGDDSSDSEEEQRILTLPERPMHPARSVALPAGIQTAMVPVSTPQTDKNPRLSTSMLRRLIFSRAAKTLQRLWIYEMAVSMHQLQIVALSIMSEHLKDIVVHLYEFDVDALALYLSKFKCLQSVHIMSHVRSQADLSYDQLLRIARQCCESLVQIGFRNRVWNVVVKDSDRILQRYDMAAGIYPEKLLVVRAMN